MENLRYAHSSYIASLLLVRIPYSTLNINSESLLMSVYLPRFLEIVLLLFQNIYF